MSYESVLELIQVVSSIGVRKRGQACKFAKMGILNRGQACKFAKMGIL